MTVIAFTSAKGAPGVSTVVLGLGAVWMQVLRLRLMRPLTRMRHLATMMTDLIYACWWWSVIYAVGAVTWLCVRGLPKTKRHL